MEDVLHRHAVGREHLHEGLVPVGGAHRVGEVPRRRALGAAGLRPNGGLDGIAAAALGPQRLQAVLMPSPWSSTGSVDDALALADRLGIANQTVTISGTAGGRDVKLSAVTNADGEYTFAELIPGAYTITSPATSGYTATGTEAGSLGGTPGTDSISDITIAPGDLGDGYLLGRSAQLTVSGRVFLDRNANGAVDSVDTLLSGIRVTLTGTASTGESITRHGQRTQVENQIERLH